MAYREKYITLEQYRGEYKSQGNPYIGFVIGYGYCYTSGFAIQPPHMNGYSPSCGRLYGDASHYIMGEQQVEDTSPEAVKLSLRGLFVNGEAVITIKSGMTLSHLAALFDVTVGELAKWNNIENHNKIYAGQKIRIIDRKHSALNGFVTIADPLQKTAHETEKYTLGPEWLSYVPLVGSGRDAYVDFQNGQYGWAVFNTLMAVSDIFLVKSLIVAGGKIATKTAFKTGANTWTATRSWLGRTGQAGKGQPVHHWLLHQNQGIGKHAPEWLKNQPWNLKTFPDASSHMRFGHGINYNKALPGNALEQVWHGTPMWPKAVSGSVGGRIIEQNLNNTE